MAGSLILSQETEVRILLGVLKLFIMKTNKKVIIAIILGMVVMFSVGLFSGTKIAHYDYEANYIKE